MKFSVDFETNGNLGNTLKGKAQGLKAKAKSNKLNAKVQGAVKGWKQS